MGIEPVKKRIYKKPEIKKCGKIETTAARTISGPKTTV
jgi:hypothetical protein